MELRFGELTRGSGKIYQKVLFTHADDTVKIQASVLSGKGIPLPASVVMLPQKNACVVVMAVFAVSQRLNVTALDAAGSECASASRLITPGGARLTSQFNTLCKNALAEEIRNIDEYSEHPRLRIELEKVIYTNDEGENVIRGRVHLLAISEAEALSSLELSFFNKRAEYLHQNVWILMADSCKASSRYEGYYERVLVFSIVVPASARTFACWACAPSLDLSAVVCLRPFEMREKRQLWLNITDSAQTTVVYDEWFRIKHRTPALVLLRQRETKFAIEPSFSIVVPVYKTPLPFLCEMIESVIEQTYAHWELILVNASPEDTKLCNKLQEYGRADERVRIVAVDENKGIVGNTYAGVAQATGDFVSFFDHDDVLEPDLLWHYVKGINDYPTTDLLYCDEDKLLEGKYVSPFFKPDWSPDLLMSENYVCHMLTVRKTIVDQLPPMIPGEYDGSQDHFLTLFAGERARNVFHARRVLYHWRMHAQSTAANAGSKSYTEEAGVRAIQSHLDRCGIPATVRPSGVAPNTYHVDYTIANEPLVSIIIPNKDMVDVLTRCIDSILLRSTYGNYEIVIVENNSVEQQTFDYYREVVERDQRVHVVQQPSNGTFNFSRIVNCGAKHAQGEYLLFLNNDTEVRTPDWIERLMGPLVREEVGITGAKLLYPDGLIQHAGVLFHTGTGPFHVSANLPSNSLHYYCSPQLVTNYSAVTAACMLTKRSIFEELGGFDETLAVDYNDIDFCLRVRERNMLVVYEPTAVLMHYESISRGAHLSRTQRKQWTQSTSYLMHRWTDYYIDGDPYCNPNLSFSAYHQLKWDVD